MEERITSEKFPCGHHLDARRKPHGRLWFVQELKIYEYDGAVTDVGRMQILASSIPGTIRFLQKLYDNTPGDDNG